jgi:ferrochelatase
MKADGIRSALAFVTSAFSSYSGCRQYRENIAAAQEQVGDGAPTVDKLRLFFNHPGFIRAMADHVQAALLRLPAEVRENALVVYTAHSIPLSMAQSSDYVKQLDESRRLVSESLGRAEDALAYQSRSGPPTQPWLEPDILEVLREIKRSGSHPAVVVAPIGFISDHLEVLYDLDTEARAVCDELQLPMERASTVSTHSAFAAMVVDLVQERIENRTNRLAMGALGPWHDVCPADCCPAPQRPRT